MILFPTVDEVITLHERLISQYGGTSGVRDHGLLESALFRPQTGYYESLVDMAAALLESLLLNHAFVDGNKRVAFATTNIFLIMNGYKISVGAKLAEEFICGVVSVDRDQRMFQISKWIEKYLKKIK